ncbi:MAG: malto-oligosyltrehalose synthase [Verrucomicrobia bacterium]|nr:MAG: malto-oligosyltrehalose synthase [Verrucomicrobiota bacterium]
MEQNLNPSHPSAAPQRVGCPRIPSATYRLQFHSGFTFRNAVGILDYLNELGISDIYASPYFQAGIESTHGYDVADHNALNPAVGNKLEYQQFVTELRRHSMGQLLDFVPNHMGISESLNQWWMDVLENGPASVYADYFDIDWHPRKEVLADKVLLPILGERYGRILENSELILEREGGLFFVRYSSAKLPINPRTFPIILRRSLHHLQSNDLNQMLEIIEQLTLPSTEEIARAKLSLANFIAQNPAVRRAIDLAVLEFQGTVGVPESFDALHELLECQSYRLAYWRVAAEEINYRRFFDINHLAAIRVEIPEVFEAAHHLVFQLLADGSVSGLRIDHIDGLWNPKEYLVRLQENYAALAHTAQNPQALYLIVEKILEIAYEQLPADWPISGTTGYEFANQITHLLIDAASVQSFTEIYQDIVGVTDTFSNLVYEKKCWVMETSFESEIVALARQLDGLSEFYRTYRDCTRNVLMNAIRQVIACFPVYRTYATEHRPPCESEKHIILRAISLARRKNPAIDKTVFDFLRDVLLMGFPENCALEQRKAHVRFVMRFQQCTGPVAAKGLEDTVFYLYNRLIALNEVGGNPGNFGLSTSEFHQLNLERTVRTPHTLLGTSTHDTKRSEDVRLRIAALSEMPLQWRKAIRRWMRMNRKFRTMIDGEPAPSPNEEYFLYQTLVGCWPFELTPKNRDDFTTRIQQYLIKALKEGKVNSSWTEPNEEWEQAVTQFIAKILDPKTGAPFQKTLMPLAEEVAHLGAWNSLTETVLKCTLPGVPDFYQGTEIWDFSLVDPDNRRPVDYSLRKRLLKSIASASPEELIFDWKSGRIKLFVIQRLLQFRRAHEEFFRMADYLPVFLQGPKTDHLITFLRMYQDTALLVVVPRLTSRLGPVPIDQVWNETKLYLESLPGTWTDIFTDKIHAFSQREALISNILSSFPFAVLSREKKEPRPGETNGFS